MSGEGTVEGWFILELFGHRKLAGYLREVEIAGHGFIRIDIPGEPEVTQFYQPKAVYGMTPTTEATARRAATLGAPAPVHHWELPQTGSIADAVYEEVDDDEPTEDEDGDPIF